MRNRISRDGIIRLHLGAHRTATTALHATLEDNASLLADCGVRALTPWRPGRREHEGLRRVAHSVARATGQKGLRGWRRIREARRELRTLVGEPSAKVLVLSDENLLGNPFSYPHGEAIYPNCQSRLKATSRVVFKPPQRVHLTIRNYATFLVSVYAMSALYRPEAPAFETVKDRFLRLDQRWPAVLRATRYVFSNSKITFSRYENTPIQTALVALVEPEVTLRRIQEPIQQRVNVAPTVEAIEEALRSPPASPGEADSLVFKLAAGTPFDPLSPDEKAELSEIYEADIRALKKEFTEIDDSMIETTASEPSRASGTGN